MNKDYILVSVAIQLMTLKMSLENLEAPTLAQDIQNILDFITKSLEANL